jgi:choline dehydrogenase-like flavoprotein
MPQDFDVIVVGSGAGGGTFASACARAGKSVLLVERGSRYELKEPVHDERAMLFDKKPYDDRTVWVNGAPKRLYVGGVFGGSTSLYGAVLLRPSKEDFHPGKTYGNRIPQAIWDWPITYKDLEPFYTEAEELYGLSGCSEDDFGPLQKPAQGFPAKAFIVKPVNRKLMEANKARGLKPFRLPLAIDFARCLQCGVCPGYICPNGARRSSTQLVEAAVASGAPLHVRTGVEVECLTADGRGKFNGVRLCDRSTGEREVYRARRYVLAAGAIGSPTLLLRSGARGPWIGRNYMFHLSPVVAGVFPTCTGAEATFVKQVGFADYYFGTEDYAHKMGVIQSLPVPGPLMIGKAASYRLPRWVVQFLRRRLLPLVGIVEDLPDPANRVSLGKDGTAEIRHAFGPYDRDRGRHLSRLMGRILKAAGALFCLSTPLSPDEHVGHQCGTLRFGKNPADAVLDAECRMFDQRNVFVVDGSFLPTSLGVGPALTIMANALRVARIVVREI